MVQDHANALRFALLSVLAIKPIKVAVDSREEQGLLVLNNDVLVAVLTCLTDPLNGSEVGQWYLEAGFGHCAFKQKTFSRLEDALAWVAKRLELDVDAAVASALAGYEPPHPAAGGSLSAI